MDTNIILKEREHMAAIHNTDRSRWGTFAVVWYDRLSTEISHENVHLTIAPNHHDALRFAICCNWYDDEEFHTLIFNKLNPSSNDSDEENRSPERSVPWGNWRELYRLSTLTNSVEDDHIIRVIRLHRRDRLIRTDNDKIERESPYILSYFDNYGEPIIRICHAETKTMASHAFLTTSSPQINDIVSLTYAMINGAVWKYNRPIISTQTPSFPLMSPSSGITLDSVNESLMNIVPIRLPGPAFCTADTTPSPMTSSSLSSCSSQYSMNIKAVVGRESPESLYDKIDVVVDDNHRCAPLELV